MDLLSKFKSFYAHGIPGSSGDKISLIYNPRSPYETIYLSGVQPVTYQELDRLKIQRILNVGAAYIYLDQPPENIEYMLVNILDHPDIPIDSYFDQVCRFISHGYQNFPTPVPTLIHCYAGMSRSVTFLLAYLLMTSSLTLKEALQIVSNARPGINPNDGFIQGVINLAIRLNKNDL